MRARSRLLRRGVALGLIVAGAALAQGVSESAVKAAFVFNFIKFTDWPNEALPAGNEMLLCVAGGKDGFSLALAALEGKVVQGHALKIRAIARKEDLPGCHILAVADSEAKRSAELFKVVQTQAVLTVGEGETMLEAGSLIALVSNEQKVAFEVNSELARRSPLRISAQLLKLARNMRK